LPFFCTFGRLPFPRLLATLFVEVLAPQMRSRNYHRTHHASYFLTPFLAAKAFSSRGRESLSTQCLESNLPQFNLRLRIAFWRILTGTRGKIEMSVSCRKQRIGVQSNRYRFGGGRPERKNPPKKHLVRTIEVTRQATTDMLSEGFRGARANWWQRVAVRNARRRVRPSCRPLPPRTRSCTSKSRMRTRGC
jgi:hypothetical protein